MTDLPPDQLFVGGELSPDDRERTGGLTLVDPDDFVTHGVIVGMTGSGKTGLGIVVLEEALLQGVPVLAIDPKGDLGNLALTFPDLRPEDFLPWVDPQEAQRAGKPVEDVAAEVAASWRDGLAGWGIDGARIRRLHDQAPVTVYTPGSSSGVPIDLIGSLRAPAAGVDPETLEDEIEGFVTGLLALAGIEADPLTSAEHILLTNLIADQWGKGRDLDLAALLGLVQDPPMRKLGVIELDTFFPPADRTKLVVRLNGLLASPSFQSWAQGAPLDMATLLWTPQGKPRAAIITIAHLSDEERQFVVTLLLSKLITWMRAQPGTATLRALVYMDEVFGYVPPNGAPPAKKPILTILKQARAFGVGMVLASQNPVDIDYKALSNAGTWMIGRLQTERDKGRLLEGLTAASGGVDIGQVDATISSLGKRQFVLQRSGSSGPKLFTTRWAMSYLRGPFTRDQIAQLTADAPERRGAAGAKASAATAPAGAAHGADAGGSGAGPTAGATADGPLADDETSVAPAVAAGRRVGYLDPAAPWATTVGAASGGNRLAPALVATVQLLYDDTRAEVRETEQWEAVLFPLTEPIDWSAAIQVDHDPRDLRPAPPAGAVYQLGPVDLSKPALFREAERALVTHLRATEELALLRNKALGIIQRPGEAADAFAARAQAAADQRADEEASTIRVKLAARADKIRDAMEEAEARASDLRQQQRAKQAGGLLKAAGGLLSSFLGGKKSSRALARTIGSAAGDLASSGSSSADAAERRAAEGCEDLTELEADLARQLQELDQRWDEVARRTDTVRIPLEAADITVVELSVCWVPVV